MINGLSNGTPVDAIFVNSPLKNYDLAPRFNDFTLPVLGLGYIATYAQLEGFNVGVLDAEARGLGISVVADAINAHRPRWVGLNLLAPTYRHSVDILQRIHPDIRVMLGGHQAKAMPQEILQDSRISRIDAMILGEGEYRAVAVLRDTDARRELPQVWWREAEGPVGQGVADQASARYWLSPHLETMPLIERSFLVQDPFTADDGRVEANLVGSRGCPFNCSFCGAAQAARDILASTAFVSPGRIDTGHTKWTYIESGTKGLANPDPEEIKREGWADLVPILVEASQEQTIAEHVADLAKQIRAERLGPPPRPLPPQVGIPRDVNRENWNIKVRDFFTITGAAEQAGARWMVVGLHDKDAAELAIHPDNIHRWVY